MNRMCLVIVAAQVTVASHPAPGRQVQPGARVTREDGQDRPGLEWRDGVTDARDQRGAGALSGVERCRDIAAAPVSHPCDGRSNGLHGRPALLPGTCARPSGTRPVDRRLHPDRSSALPAPSRAACVSGVLRSGARDHLRNPGFRRRRPRPARVLLSLQPGPSPEPSSRRWPVFAGVVFRRVWLPGC